MTACPDNCGSSEGRGRCRAELKSCQCEGGWKGEACRQRAEEVLFTLLYCAPHRSTLQGWWEAVVSSTPPPPGRTSHAALVAGEAMWVVGGEFLHRAPPDSLVTRWDFSRGEWEGVAGQGSVTPSERYGHSAVLHSGSIFMYGGVMRSGHVSKELWSLDLETEEWTREEPRRGKCHR